MPELPARPEAVLKWTGEFERSMLDAHNDVIEFLDRFVAARITASSATTLTTGADLTIGLDTLDRDDGQLWDSGNPERLTFPFTGWWSVAGGTAIAAGGGTTRTLYIYLNGATALARCLFAPSTANTAHLNVTTGAYYFAVGDYVTLQAMQNSGGNLNASGGWMSAHFVAP